MTSSRPPDRDKLIVDSIHGDIRLRPLERRVIDTASFQRLRHLKQLQLGHVTYPGATDEGLAQAETLRAKLFGTANETPSPVPLPAPLGSRGRPGRLRPRVPYP